MQTNEPPPATVRGGDQRRLLLLALVGAAVVVASVLIAIVLGELPEVLWVLLVPIGMLGGGITCATCLGLAAANRRCAALSDAK